MEEMSSRERSKQFSKVKKKFEVILSGFYEVEIDIFLNKEIKHLIYNSIINQNQSQKHIEFKSPHVESSTSLKPKFQYMKQLIKSKNNEL